jgi:hypothetical protein
MAEQRKSSLIRLSMSDLNAAIARGVKDLESKVPSAAKTKAKMFSASTEKSKQAHKQRRADALQTLADYKRSMQFARSALRKLPKNATQKEYLDAGLPLINKSLLSSYKMSDTNFFQKGAK